MSLPACQQRALDRIGASLQAGEPRLAAMFAIFTRLCRNEAPPAGEQLKDRTALADWLAGLGWQLRRMRAGLMPRAGRARRGVRTISSRGRVLLVSQVAAVFVLLAVLLGGFGLGSGCGGQQVSRGAVSSAGSGHACSSQPGQTTDWVGK